MSALSILFAAMFYAAAAALFFGFLSKIYQFAATPSPLKIPTAPAPTTALGAAGRVAGEVLFFTSLFKGNKWTWLGGYVFHVALALVLLRHLRYFLQPTPKLVELAGPPGVWAGIIMTAALVYLWIRRKAVDRAAYISLLADYFALGLIALIGVTGLVMKFVIRTDVAAVKSFIIGLVTFSPVEMPADPMFMLHLLLVMALMVYFPFSKLLHAGGVFFSPTRAQVDDCRERRHVNPWA
ncbi:MAG: respiratory nitrate reductase subunit gamma [Nitrospinae bacterium]|nr:respiratory nitrate reductase subunit gamma [Nitrospinota bacterium]